MDEDKFLQMLLLDGCFIIVSLYGTAGLFVRKQEVGDGSSCNVVKMEEDRANYGIYELLVSDDSTSRLLTDNIGECIEGVLFNYPKSIKEFERPVDFHHLVHLCHMYFRPRAEEHQHCAGIQYFGYFRKKYFKVGNQLEENHWVGTDKQNFSLHGEPQILRWRRAEQYHDAGIEFKKRPFDHKSPHSLLDINFVHGVVEIPFLMIDDKTSFLFRNIVAVEQSCPQFGNYFTAYLLSLPKDVTILAKRGIIVHQMHSDDEVSVLFTKLGKNVDFDVNGKYYLRHLCHVMEEHYQSRLNR
uniref:Uncharacterized protein n=1 Tax=Oryza rufipogon TaxID=4529 RepID=A0A0E0MXB6_ORYRU